MKPATAKPLLALLSVILCFVATSAMAQVTIAFHSFNGSVLFGRYPHTFVVFDGTLDSTGQKIHENFGYTAKVTSPAVLAGPVKQAIYVESEKYVRSTNTHFIVPISDATYFQMMAEIEHWRDGPDMLYDLNHHNCIHFVGKLAEMAGLKVDFPKDLLHKPRAWLNHIALLNPQLHARQIH